MQIHTRQAANMVFSDCRLIRIRHFRSTPNVPRLNVGMTGQLAGEAVDTVVHSCYFKTYEV